MNEGEVYYSCCQIRNGFNFYRSSKVNACCFSLDKALEITDISDPVLPVTILKFQNNLITRHKNNTAPDACKKCVYFIKDDWSRYKFGIFQPNNVKSL